MESWMVERAREELQMLEAQHPDRFDYLKLELRSLIADGLHLNDPSSGPSDSAPTQASSNNRKRKGNERAVSGRSKWRRSETGGSKSRVERAIERAEACLKRIRQVKQSFFS